MTRLKNKTAVITGGTTGIGFATAKEFISEGARVIITGKNEARLAEAARKLGENAIAFSADVRSLDDLHTLATKVKEEFGSLDILFANAGIVRTEFQGKMDLPKEAIEGFIDAVRQAAPLQRDGEVTEIAKAVVFLASDESSYMTAADLVVDGGYMNV